jgi:hypothetical protein
MALVLGGCDTWFYYPTRDQRVVAPPSASASASASATASATAFELESETLRIASSDEVTLHAQWIAARGESQGTVVYCYGYDKNLSYHLEPVRWLPAAGFNLLVFDYRGFGRSTGTPTRRGTVDDASVAIDVALRRDPRRTIVFGHSLGGAVGVVAAGRRPAVRAVIAESTFPTYRAAARARLPILAWLVPLLVSGELDPVAALPLLAPRPLLVIHGAADRAVPVGLGRQLFERAVAPKRLLVIEGGSHRAPWGEDASGYRAAIVEFLVGAVGG